MQAWEMSVEAMDLRRKFDDDEDEFEDDGFTFDDDDEEDEDLDDADDLDEDDLDDEELEELARIVEHHGARVLAGNRVARMPPRFGRRGRAERSGSSRSGIRSPEESREEKKAAHAGWTVTAVP